MERQSHCAVTHVTPGVCHTHRAAGVWCPTSYTNGKLTAMPAHRIVEQPVGDLRIVQTNPSRLNPRRSS